MLKEQTEKLIIGGFADAIVENISPKEVAEYTTRKILNLFKAKVSELTVIETNPYWDAPHGSLEGVYEAGKQAQCEADKKRLLGLMGE